MLTDVIAAISTPPGRAALAVIRISGEGALGVVGRLVGGLDELAPRHATLVRLIGADGATIDQAVLTVYRAPASYTGQDLIELSCHGGLLIPAQILSALYAAGARPAEPGEFTRRAVLNGKLDLLQAEAVVDLIDASAPAQARAALHQLEGGLSRRLTELRDSMLELLALLSYDIDFPEEDEGPVPWSRIRSHLDGVIAQVEHLLATAPAGERLREGALVVLAGRPNAGKSSLFNALLGTNRAIVTEIPGTTRDAIEASTDVLGWPVRLVDTAGLHEADERIERMGIEVSRRYVDAADLLLLCVESGRGVEAAEQAILAEKPALLVRTKADLVATREGESGLPVSALSGDGLDRLREQMRESLFADGAAFGDLTPMLTRERHRIALSRARDSLELAKPELTGRGDSVLAAHHVRNAVDELDELIGVVHPDDVLGRVFERFCVGK